jgi:hypothetical protein
MKIVLHVSNRNRWFLLSFILACIALLPMPVSAALYTFNPTADAFVMQSDPNTNYNGTELRVGNNANEANYASRTFLRFNLGSIPASEQITGATLRLYCYSPYESRSLTIGAYNVSDNTWIENGITWNNQPSFGGLIASNDSSSYNVWYDWILTPSLLTKGEESFLLKEVVENSYNKFHRRGFDSRENGDSLLIPQLVITTTPVPLPPGILLLAPGLLGLIGLKRKYLG